MKRFQFRTLAYPALLACLFLIPGVLPAQDQLTESELEELRIHRERLIQEGILQSDKGVQPLASTHNEPYIGHASYTDKSEPVATDGSRATDFSPDGTRFYILGRDSGNIIEYHLSTAWDIESITYERELDISPEMGSGAQTGAVPNGLYIRKEDGARLWVFNRTEIWEYTLSTPWNVSTATQTGYEDFSSIVFRGHDIDFKPDGTILYVDDRILERVFQYQLSTPWDVETANHTYTLDISEEQEEVRGTQLNADGSRMYLMDTAKEEILEYYLQTPYSLSSANYIGSFNVQSQTSDPRGLTFNPDFTSFYVTSEEENRIYQYELRYVDPDESSLSANREKVIANGTATSRITVTLRDSENVRLEGRKVTLTSDSPNVLISTVNGTSDSDGEARYNVRNSSKETVTFQATAMGTEIDQTVSVRFVGLDPDESTLASSREKVLANGSAFSRITVTAKDEDGDVLQGVEISLLPDGGDSSIEEVEKITNSDGIAEFRVSNKTAERVTYEARGTGTTISQEVTVSFVTVDPALSEVNVDPATIQADSDDFSNISVLARDEDGDLLAGASVRLEAQNGSSTIEEIQNTTDSGGEAFFRVRNSIPETVLYTIIAEEIELDEKAEVHFVPVAPVSLDAREVGTDQFTAAWEPVEGAETYLLDVATDSSFTSFVGDYQNKSVGNNTSELIDNLNPGQSYVYRVRAESMGLISKYSDTAGTTTYPETPVALPASGRNAFQFTANWEAADGAEQYRMDVASDEEFQQMVTGYEDVIVTGEEHEITGLEMGTRYFYRIRSEAGPRTSPNSNSIETNTLTISSENSDISKAQIRVLADGNQTNEIHVTVKSEEGTLLRGLEVTLESPDELSEIEAVQPVTDEHGVARFTVRRSEAGTITYQILIKEIVIGDVTVEFLEDDGELKLGDNFPNPFRSETRLPVSIPNTMEVRLTIYNSLGAPVRTVLDETMETGFYEIPVRLDNLASGVYFYRLIANGEVKTGKMVLVK
ncbi:MAG: Ig-like domain-containing protein [Balneolaceae bacterium]